MPDVFDLLKEDHVELKSRLGKVKDAVPEDREFFFGEAMFLLSRHATFEEEILYPNILDFLDKDTIAIIDDEKEEHRQMEHLLAILSDMEKYSVKWQMSFSRLHTLFDRHAYNEENAFFPRARKQIPGEKLDELASYFHQIFR